MPLPSPTSYISGMRTKDFAKATPSMEILNCTEFGYTRQIEVVGDNVWFTTSVGRLYHSTNRGATWTVYTTPVPDFGGAVTSTSSANISFSSPTNGLIVTNNGVVYRTVNSGATWTTVTTTGPVYTNGLCFIEG